MRLTISTVLMTLALSLTANADALMPDYSAERQKFTKALQLLQKNQLTSYKKYEHELRDYPLSSYLKYYALRKKLNSASTAEVSSFLSEYKNTPLANQLNRKWLSQLAKKKRWNIYRQHYAHHPIQSTHYSCLQQTALLNGSPKERKSALYNAKRLWLVGNSQPKSCDPLFKEWMKTGRPTSSEATQRFWLSLEQGNVKLAKYLGRYITEVSHKKQSALFWNVYEKPSLIEGKKFLSLPEEHQATVAALSYKQWYKSHPVSASKSWALHRDQFISDIELKQKITTYMGERLNRRYHSQAYSLSHLLDPNYAISDLTIARIRHGLSQQNWKSVATSIKHLPEALRQDPQWQYWSLIANMHINPDQDVSPDLELLAENRSFYGFLAAELNNSPFQLNAADESVSDTEMSNLAMNPGIQRSHELFKLGRLIEANREWFQVQNQLNESEKAASGYLAKSWGWHLQAIINAAKTKRWDNIDLRFPHPHASLFKSHAIKNNMDLSFPVAIARQESAFLQSAQSRVGARGLMQLMPATAKQTAKKHNVPYRRSSELNNPKLNITLGSAYLGDMLKKFDGNPAYAAAAYNAGPHRVTRWLKQRGDLPLDIWIETIPFKETRKYVKNVLAFRVIYDRLEGRQASLLTEKQIELLAVNQSNKVTL